MKEIYFSEIGYEKHRMKSIALEEKLRELQENVAMMVDVGGDCWHDNSGYEQLIIDIRGLDKQLVDLKKELNKAKVIEYPKNPQRVMIGTRVRYIFDSEEKTYDIVGFGEAEPKKNIISYQAPLALQSLGLEERDIFQFNLGNKKLEIEIGKITHII